MAVSIENQPDFNVLLDEPKPFEMDLPWGEKEFSERFYKIVHFWGIPTEKEVAFLAGYLNTQSDRILDLACGGGRHSIELAAMGYDITGIDIGQHPLEVARAEAKRRNLLVDFIHGDMLRMDLGCQFDLAFFICNQISHLSPEDCRQLFRNVGPALTDGGIFIVHLVRFSEEDKSSFVHWYLEKEAFYLKNRSVVHREQFYFDKERTKLIRDFAIDTVTRENRLFGVSEKNYTRDELQQCASEAGLILKESFGDYDRSPLGESSTHKIFVFTKRGQKTGGFSDN
jgi:2-polyprenyl-3-methyl-5-hydroxy-6-metoxy-1,4-benzoquinol methylase